MLAMLLANKWLAGIALGVALCVGCWIAGDTHGHHVASAKGDAALATLKAADATALAQFQASARTAEQSSATRLAAIESQHQKELADAQANSDRVIADLRAGTLRLRKQWQCPDTPGRMPAATGSTGEPAATTDDRAASAARIVRAADDADAEIRALQAIVTADRQ